MTLNDSILKQDEKIALTLRSLYAEHGYRQFKMSKFEEYDLYMKNKDFLISDGIITFTDTNGTLLALKPDVTLSIVKHTKDVAGDVQKVHYHETVYRIAGSSHTYKELLQTGLECIGDIQPQDIAEVVQLACASTALLGENTRTVLSHIGFVELFFADYGIDPRGPVATAFFERNTDVLASLCDTSAFSALQTLLVAYPSAPAAKTALLPLCRSAQSAAALEQFAALWETVFCDPQPAASVDFSLSNSTGYYSGIVFKGYCNGIAAPVLSGGQYDGLMQKLGRTSHAIGFAVYLDELEHWDTGLSADTDYINIALPKGRLGETVYAMFEKAGFDCPAIKEQNRKLIFENAEKKLRFFWVKPSDVAIYVERGAADIGVAGYDILLEYAPQVYELCDLRLGKCRMAVAAKADFCDDENKTLRVATKFSNIARRFYAEKCRDIDIIHLNGSIELAPILGMSDVIVDIVETGKTLYENNLKPYEDIVPISARLIANKAAYQFKQQRIEEIRESIAKQVTDCD